MNYFEEGDVTDINYQRAIVEMRKMRSPEYLIKFWRAVGVWRSKDTPRIENCMPWNKGIEHLTK